MPIWLHSKLYCCFANIDLGLSRPTQQTIYSEHQPLTVIHLEAWANCCVHQHCCVASIGSNVLPDQRVGCTEFIESHHVIHCVLPQCILYHSPAQWNLWLHIIGHSVCVPYTISYGTLLHAYLDWHGAFPNISNSLHLSMGHTFLKFPMKITCEYCPILLMISNTFLSQGLNMIVRLSMQSCNTLEFKRFMPSLGFWWVDNRYQIFNLLDHCYTQYWYLDL